MSMIEQIVALKGPPRGTVRVSQQRVDDLAGRAPAELVNFWQRYGFATYEAGMFHVCDPEIYDPVVQLIFDGDDQLNSRDILVYAFTAFGHVFCYHHQFGCIDIDLLTGAVGSDYIAGTQRPAPADQDIALRLVEIDTELYDALDTNLEPLFMRAAARLGVPGLDECFGFFPALRLGAPPRLESLRKVAAPEHFALLAQMGPFQLNDTSTFPEKPLRLIGR